MKKVFWKVLCILICCCVFSACYHSRLGQDRREGLLYDSGQGGGDGKWEYCDGAPGEGVHCLQPGGRACARPFPLRLV